MRKVFQVLRLKASCFLAPLPLTLFPFILWSLSIILWMEREIYMHLGEAINQLPEFIYVTRCDLQHYIMQVCSKVYTKNSVKRRGK